MKIKIAYRRDDCDVNEIETLCFETDLSKQFDLNSILYFTKKNHQTNSNEKIIKAQIANYKVIE